MFEALGHKAGRALNDLLDSSVDGPLVDDDTGYLRFFTRVVERLEGEVMRARQLIEEQSRDILRRAVSRIFGNLLHLDPRTDFRALLEPMPVTVADPVEGWVSDHVDVLVTELVPAIDDALVLVGATPMVLTKMPMLSPAPAVVLFFGCGSRAG